MRDPLRSLVVRFRELFPARRRLVLVGCLVAGVLFLFASNRDAGPGRHQTVPSASVGPMGGNPREANALKSSHLQAELYRSGPGDSKTGMFLEPRIAYSAELSLTTKEFAHSRSSLEEILERHRGYVARLRMVGQPSGSVLSATLRVPSSECRSTLTELKAVGFVEHEEEAADEITQQHGELEARDGAARLDDSHQSNEFSGCSRIEQRRSTTTDHLNARLPCCALKSSGSNRSVLLPAAASPSQTSLSPCVKNAPRSPKPSERSFEAPPSAVCLMRLRVSPQSFFFWPAAAPCSPCGPR